MDYDKLINELNDWNEYTIAELCGMGKMPCQTHCDNERCIVSRAATAIETLRAENDRLRADWEKYQPREHWETLNEAVDNLRADLARVTAELNDLRAQWDMYGGDVGITETYKELEWVKAELESKEKYYEQMIDALSATDSADLARVTAERDAAIKDIWAAKWVSCKYGTDCDFISAMTGCPDCAGCSNWKWRGIKED